MFLQIISACGTLGSCIVAIVTLILYISQLNYNKSNQAKNISAWISDFDQPSNIVTCVLNNSSNAPVYDMIIYTPVVYKEGILSVTHPLVQKQIPVFSADGSNDYIPYGHVSTLPPGKYTLTISYNTSSSSTKSKKRRNDLVYNSIAIEYIDVNNILWERNGSGKLIKKRSHLKIFPNHTELIELTLQSVKN